MKKSTEQEYTKRILGVLIFIQKNLDDHEIYLSDPRRIAPEKLKTILRMPVREKRIGR